MQDFFDVVTEVRAPPGPMPKATLQHLAGRVQIYQLSLHHQKISFRPFGRTQRPVRDNFVRSMKEARRGNPIRPLDWYCMRKRLEVLDRAQAKNTNGRVWFFWDHCFLVKYYFTFGMQVVPESRWHVVQSTAAPMLFFRPKEIPRRVVLWRFDDEEEEGCERFVLHPYRRYVLPPGTTYMLVAVQKTLFTFHVVDAPMEGGADPTEHTTWSTPEEEEDALFCSRTSLPSSYPPSSYPASSASSYPAFSYPAAPTSEDLIHLSCPYVRRKDAMVETVDGTGDVHSTEHAPEEQPLDLRVHRHHFEPLEEDQPIQDSPPAEEVEVLSEQGGGNIPMTLRDFVNQESDEFLVFLD